MGPSLEISREGIVTDEVGSGHCLISAISTKGS